MSTTPTFFQTDRLWSRAEVFSPDRPVPPAPGVYAWFFRSVPPGVPTEGCYHRDGATLLYIGISPKAPPTNGRAASRSTLARRIRYHYRGNAEGSTLRLSLGCLLSDALGLQLRRVGSGERLTFAAGETTLSAWMADHALVTWLVTPRPWTMESTLIERVSLPLNLDQNRNHPFHPVLSAKRAAARVQARALPIWRPSSFTER